MKKLHGLYGISDNLLTPKRDIFKQLDSAINGGLRIFQYRDKESSDRDIVNLVLELQDFCKQKDVLFILNDRYELAMKLQLDGLHVGKEEIVHFRDIRVSFRGIIGVSCYDSVTTALEYENLGADYVAFGAMFKSKIKTDANICDISVLDSKDISVPICAIGGIDSTNANRLKCDMIAVISALWGDGKSLMHIQENAKRLIESWHSAKRGHND